MYQAIPIDYQLLPEFKPLLKPYRLDTSHVGFAHMLSLL
jgi:hypothetical protein